MGYLSTQEQVTLRQLYNKAWVAKLDLVVELVKVNSGSSFIKLLVELASNILHIKFRDE